MRERDPEALQRAEVVGVSERVTEALELVPVVLLALFPELCAQVLPKVLDDTVVVEQRVVDIEQVDDFVEHPMSPYLRR